MEKAMRRTFPRRTIYAATVIAILATIGGFVMAAGLSGFNTTTVYQGQQGVTITGLPGLTYVSTTLGTDPGSAMACPTSGSACDTGSGITVCASQSNQACNQGDYAELVNFTVAKPWGGPPTWNVRIQLNALTPVTSYFTTSGSDNGGTLELVYDLGATPFTVTAIAVIANGP